MAILSEDEALLNIIWVQHRDMGWLLVGLSEEESQMIIGRLKGETDDDSK